MTSQEAIEIITNAIQTDNMTAEQDKALAIVQKALEKQIPKKPIPTEEQNIRFAMNYICPSCKKHFTGTGIADYCYHCGQALDWSDDK